MLRTGNSIQLIVASYKILVDLEKGMVSLIVSLDNATVVSEAGDKQSGGPLDPSSFHLLIEELTETLTEFNIQATSMKLQQNLLLFQYLVIVLESDFLPRNATMNWSLQRESLLNMLLIFSEPKWKLEIVVQYLWKYITKAQLSILSERNANDNIVGDRKEGAGALIDLCQAFISAFDSLRSTDSDMEILSIGKEALFTAATAKS
ncbi:hypothetical protein TSUD_96570 [Trifolium subterraneum]|nr:hypothetical protein TSUD_96570 [Trifolium subterraneum]